MKLVKWIKSLILFLIGGAVYTIIEIIWRIIRESSPTHWAMFILGGIAFLIIGGINECMPRNTPFWLQALTGTTLVLILELIFGCVLNIWLGLGIWDYSHLPHNILGQICLPFAFAWLFLVSAAILLDDYLRYWLFGEEKPKYCWKFK